MGERDVEQQDMKDHIIVARRVSLRGPISFSTTSREYVLSATAIPNMQGTHSWGAREGSGQTSPC